MNTSPKLYRIKNHDMVTFFPIQFNQLQQGDFFVLGTHRKNILPEVRAYQYDMQADYSKIIDGHTGGFTKIITVRQALSAILYALPAFPAVESQNGFIEGTRSTGGEQAIADLLYNLSVLKDLIQDLGYRGNENQGFNHWDNLIFNECYEPED